MRDSTINGLPEQTINITLDGVNVNNNQDKAGDGFYAMVSPQLDAIEQVTLTTAAQGADSAGQGAVQISFVTRSGTNTLSRHGLRLLPRTPAQHQLLDQREEQPRQEPDHPAPARRQPRRSDPDSGLYDGSGKAFFFFNYEEFYQPTEATRTRTILNPNAQQGVFTYNASAGGLTGTRSVNLLELAARNGQTATFDPTVQALLDPDPRGDADRQGTSRRSRTRSNTQSYIFQSPGKGVEHLPTTKVDFNLTPEHRLSGTYYWQEVNRLPDIQNSGDYASRACRATATTSRIARWARRRLRSTVSPNMVNELVVGWQWSPGYFGSGVQAAQYQNQGGFSLDMPLISAATTPATPRHGGEDPRNTPNWNIDNTLNWQRGKHSLSFGGVDDEGRLSARRVFTAVPTVNFGVQTTLDPADAMFTTANFEGASTNTLERRESALRAPDRAA